MVLPREERYSCVYIPNGPPTAAYLAHIANISPLDGTIPPVPPATTGRPLFFFFLFDDQSQSSRIGLQRMIPVSKEGAINRVLICILRAFGVLCCCLVLEGL